jgi:hypothetical protein
VPAFVSKAYLLNPVAFLALSYVLLWATSSGERTSRKRVLDAGAIVGLGLVSLAIVYAVWLAHIIFGELPELVGMSMPWRFSNVTATLLIPVSVSATAAIVTRLDERDALFARTVVVPLLLIAAFGVPIGLMLVLLWGLPLGLGLWLIRSTPGQLLHLLLPLIGMILAAATLWPGSKTALYLAPATGACLTGAWLSRRLASRSDLRVLRKVSSPAMSLAIVVCALGVLTSRGVDAARSNQVHWNQISEDDLTIGRWLTENAAADEPVLAAVFVRSELQAKTRQPVLLELETVYIMTYMPSLAPAIGTMVRDLYGVDYERADDVARQCPGRVLGLGCDVWSDAWRTRTREQWIELARKYRFRLVMTHIDIDLPMVLQTKRANLYEIPRGVVYNQD